MVETFAVTAMDNESNKIEFLHSFAMRKGRNNFKQHQSAEKLLERYKILAKEALVFRR